MACVRRCPPQLSLRIDLPKVPEYRPLSLPVTTTIVASQQVHCLSELEKLHILGQGNSGTVFKAFHKQTQAFYALKLVRGNSDAHDQVLQEIEILHCCSSSPFVIGCHGIFQEPTGDIAIVLEYMDAGSLDSILRTHGIFSEASLAKVARQVLGGLDYLQTKKIVHRDIKPSNLLVNGKMEVKIADFGVSKILKGEDSSITYGGTCAYMSPERLGHGAYGSCSNNVVNVFAGDVWSLGLSLLELYIGHYPYLAPGEKMLDSTAIMLTICLDDPPSLPDNASDNFKNFIQCCLQKEPSKRWMVSDLLTHPFVAARTDEDPL